MVVVVGNSTVDGVAHRPSAGTHDFVGVSPQALGVGIVSAERNVRTKIDKVFENVIRQNMHEVTTIAVSHIPQ